MYDRGLLSGDPRASGIYDDGTYLINNPDWHEADAPFKANWIASLLADNGICPKHVVDIGCGVGGVLANLAERLPKTTFDGYDVSSVAIETAATRQTVRVRFHIGEWPQSADEIISPDLAMAIDVFEHVDDYIGFLRHMRSIATMKLFHIPLDLSAQGLMRANSLLYSRRMIGHLHYFSKETALATLTDCGYQLIDWRYTHGAETLPHRRPVTRAVNLLRGVLRRMNEDLCVRLLGGASVLVLAK